MNCINSLPDEMMYEISSYMSPEDIVRFFLLSCNEFRKAYAASYPIWRGVIGSTPHDVLLPLLCDYGHDKKLLDDYDNPLSSSYSKMARDIAGMERLSMVHWREAHFPSEKDLFSEQEAHSTVLLTSPSMKMYLGIVPGWGQAASEFELFNVSNLPSVKRMKCKISGDAAYFKYGHSSTKVNDHLVLVHGGMSSGGYRLALNTMTIISISYNDGQEMNEGEGKCDTSGKHVLESQIVDHKEDAHVAAMDDGDSDNDHDCNEKHIGTNYGYTEGSEDCYDMSMNNDGECDSLEDVDDNEFFEVEVSLHVVQQPSGPFVSNYDNAWGTVRPTPRGYHTASVVKICNLDYLVVWGGLGNRLEFVDGDDEEHLDVDEGGLHVLYQGSQTLTHLECMSCRTLSWHNQFNVTGSEPTARFGHSCTFHPRTNSLIIIGGCDGTDLLRNGDELREIHFLTVISPNATCHYEDDSLLFSHTSFVWSEVSVSILGDPKNVSLPGRCHSATLVCRDKLLVFGGSALPSSDVTVVDIKKYSGVTLEKLEADSSIELYSPVAFGVSPTERLSTVCAHVGKYFVIQGGYCLERGCLSDCQVLDMSYGTAPYKSVSYEEACVDEDMLLGQAAFLADQKKDSCSVS